jgi:hypothetical protein
MQCLHLIPSMFSSAGILQMSWTSSWYRRRVSHVYAFLRDYRILHVQLQLRGEHGRFPLARHELGQSCICEYFQRRLDQYCNDYFYVPIIISFCYEHGRILRKRVVNNSIRPHTQWYRRKCFLHHRVRENISCQAFLD